MHVSAVIGASAAAFVLARSAHDLFGAEDPKQFVIDEVAGFLAGAVFVPDASGARLWVAAGMLFGLFRLFDVLKPFPIRRLESVGGSAGVVLDDLAAGIAAGVLVLVVFLYCPSLLPGLP